MNYKKGQIALEYLMNYGWTFLILGIVIVVILATGVFNPNSFVMEMCYLGPSFDCNSQLATQTVDTKLLINITNKLSYPIKLVNITFTTEDLGSAGESSTTKTFSNGELNTTDWKAVNVTFKGSVQPNKNTVKKIKIKLVFLICAEEVNENCVNNENYVHTVNGRIVARVI